MFGTLLQDLKLLKIGTAVLQILNLLRAVLTVAIIVFSALEIGGLVKHRQTLT